MPYFPGGPTPFWESLTAEKTCHSSKISSSLSLSFLVSLVMVRGTGTGWLTLWERVRGRRSDALLVQAASRAATLWGGNGWEDTVSLQPDMTHTNNHTFGSFKTLPLGVCLENKEATLTYSTTEKTMQDVVQKWQKLQSGLKGQCVILSYL